jgi:hypothetical protein
MVYQVTSKTFCAGLILGSHPKIAPILRRRLKGLGLPQIEQRCRELGWTLEFVGELSLSKPPTGTLYSQSSFLAGEVD